MYSCITCKRRKVKCDKRPGVCQRCEKLNIECVSSVDSEPFSTIPHAADGAARS